MVYELGGYSSNSHYLILGRLGFINPGLTLPEMNVPVVLNELHPRNFSAKPLSHESLQSSGPAHLRQQSSRGHH